MANLSDNIRNMRETVNKALGNVNLGVVGVKEVRRALGLSDRCKSCNAPILIQIFQGEDWCCDDCRKRLQGEIV